MELKFMSNDFIALLKGYYEGEKFVSHGWEDHILPVISDAQFICEKLCVPYTQEIEIACAMHDIGLAYGRENHEVTGFKMAKDILEKHTNLSKDSIDQIRSMIICHRSSMLKDKKFFDMMTDGDHIQELLISLADRCYSQISAADYFKNIARRSLRFHLAKENSMLDAISAVEKHFREKHSSTGYAYMNPLLNEVRSDSLGEYIDNKLNSPIGFDQEVFRALDGEVIDGWHICNLTVTKER